MKPIRENGILLSDIKSFRAFFKENRIELTDADKMFLLSTQLSYLFMYKEFNLKKEYFDIILETPLNLNQKLEGTIPTLLFFAINKAMWKEFNYFVSKGADIHYKVDYEAYKNINCIEYANILLKEIKVESVEVYNKIVELERLHFEFIEEQPNPTITEAEFNAIRKQTTMLEQVIFIEEFL